MSPSEKILVRGVNWLGDAVMTAPALQRLRQAKPRAHITLLTHEKLAELWRHHPAIDAVLPYQPEERLLNLAARLRVERFQTALILPNSLRSALETFFARIPKRVGLARLDRNLFLTRKIPARPEHVPARKRADKEISKLISNPALRSAPLPATAHQIFHYLHLAAALGANPEPLPPKFDIGEQEIKNVRAKFDLNHSPGSLLLGLYPGAEYGPAKRWPLERFIAAASEIARRTQCSWLIFGGPSETELGAQVALEIQSRLQTVPSPPSPSPIVGRVREGRQVINLAGRTTLPELCAALKICDLFLTNDSGPMHLAAAVGTRVVALFGSTSPALTGPGLPGETRHTILKSDVPCSPCFRRHCPIDFRCMNHITIDSVVNAVLQSCKFV